MKQFNYSNRSSLDWLVCIQCSKDIITSSIIFKIYTRRLADKVCKMLDAVFYFFVTIVVAVIILFVFTVISAKNAVKRRNNNPIISPDPDSAVAVISLLRVIQNRILMKLKIHLSLFAIVTLSKSYWKPTIWCHQSTLIEDIMKREKQISRENFPPPHHHLSHREGAQMLRSTLFSKCLLVTRRLTKRLTKKLWRCWHGMRKTEKSPGEYRGPFCWERGSQDTLVYALFPSSRNH